MTLCHSVKAHERQFRSPHFDFRAKENFSNGTISLESARDDRDLTGSGRNLEAPQIPAYGGLELLDARRAVNVAFAAADACHGPLHRRVLNVELNMVVPVFVAEPRQVNGFSRILRLGVLTTEGVVHERRAKIASREKGAQSAGEGEVGRREGSAPPLARRDPTVRLKSSERIDDRIAGDAEIFRQAALRGEPAVAVDARTQAFDEFYGKPFGPVDFFRHKVQSDETGKSGNLALIFYKFWPFFIGCASD